MLKLIPKNVLRSETASDFTICHATKKAFAVFILVDVYVC